MVDLLACSLSSRPRPPRDKAKSETGEPKSTSSDTSSSNTITNSDETVMETEICLQHRNQEKEKGGGHVCSVKDEAPSNAEEESRFDGQMNSVMFFRE